MRKGEVLLVSGSLRSGSHNAALLREAANALPSGVTHEWLTGIAALPVYSEDDDGERPPAVIGANTGIFGAIWAQAELRKALRTAGARVIDAQLAVGGAHDAFLPSGALRDSGLATGLRDLVAALVDARPLVRHI